MMKLPVDILIDIIECVDHPRDLLSLALTARALCAEIVPQHIDYRRIVCPLPFSEHVWGHLLDTPNACSRIRYLDVSHFMYRTRTEPEVPRMCGIRPSWKTWTPSFTTNGCNIFFRALSKMINLKVLKFNAMSQNLFSISEAIGKANCARDLEELDMCVELSRTGAIFDQHFEENKISEINGQSPLFYDCLSSLRKYTIRDLNHGVPTPRRHTSVFLQMLLNAPNLTHMNVSSLRSPEFLLCYWPNLQHLAFPYLGEFHEDTTGKSYTYYLRTFLNRHSKLITFSTYRALRPGWATEWDNLLPNLKSLEFDTYYPPPTSVPIIPIPIAERLTHLQMSAVLQSDLKDREIVLFNLETCVYCDANPEASIGDLVAVIPNIQKLHILFIRRGVPLPQKPTTADEIVCRLPSFAKFQHLRILSGPFNRFDISVDDNPFPKLLYELPSLSYIWGKLNGKVSPECLRLERDNVARTTRFEPVTDRLAEDECDVESWGGFYRCNYILQQRTLLLQSLPF